MSNILTLYNMEFKRIYKLYFALIGIMFISNIGSVVLNLYNLANDVSFILKVPMSIENLRTSEGIKQINAGTVGLLFYHTLIILGVATLMCLLYSLVIWYRDYYSKSKTMCTLLTLPQQRFNIYLAKLITILVMIYGVISAQFLFWYIDFNIIKIVANIKTPNFTNVLYILRSHTDGIPIASPYYIDFIMINIVGVILAVVVIFTGILIERSYKKIGIVLGVIYIILSIVIFIYISVTNSGFSDKLLILSIIYYISLFVISLVLSYRLIKKKIYL